MERREEYVGNGLLRSTYHPKQSIFASTDTDRTFATAIEFFQGFYPLESTQLASQPLQDIKQLFNPLENTQFTNMLTSSENQSQASIVTRIHRSRNPMHFDEVECPLISEFLKNDYFDIMKMHFHQSHYKVPRWEIFMEQELRFGLDLG